MTPEEIEKTAKEFSEVLKEWLTPAEMKELVQKTKENTDPDICYSHDYCDANMAMLQAQTFRDWMDREGVDFPTDPMIEHMNASWSLAKSKLFFQEVL